MPSPLRQAEERSNNQSAAWPINPASSRNQKPPPVRRWSIHGPFASRSTEHLRASPRLIIQTIRPKPAKCQPTGSTSRICTLPSTEFRSEELRRIGHNPTGAKNLQQDNCYDTGSILNRAGMLEEPAHDFYDHSDQCICRSEEH